MSDHPHSVFKTPRKLKWNCLYLIWCSLPLVLLLGTARKSPAPSSLLLQSRIYIPWWDVHMQTLISPSDLKAKKYQLLQLGLVQQMFQWDVFTTTVLCFPGGNFECWAPVSMAWKNRAIVNREITAISTFQSFWINKNHNLRLSWSCKEDDVIKLSTI